MVRDATANGLNVRVALGHSFTPVALTNGLHLTLSNAAIVAFAPVCDDRSNWHSET